MKNRAKLARVSRYILVFAGLVLCSASSIANGQSSILSVDYKNLISRADLTYQKQVSRSEAGLPIGNGTMGSLIWTTPSALKFQINRVDAYASNSSTNSFPEFHKNYLGGCGFVDIDFVDFSRGVFPPECTPQHLSVYDATATIKGKGLKARVLAWNEQDVMAVEIDDQREQPGVINTNLRMLRQPVTQTLSHTATSKLQIKGNKIILTQEFTEDDYYCNSAVVIGISGRKVRAKIANQTAVRLSAQPGNGKFTILIASAASFDRNEDVVASALGKLRAAAVKGFDGLLESNKKWWHNFWEKSFIHLNSADGTADFIEENYTYFLYVMGSSSRGKLPPKFNGMIWSTDGDKREWGIQQWWHNLSTFYRALPAANQLELMDPLFEMYSGMYDACATAARQQWGSKGIFIPETVFFDGLAELPEDIAEEMRELYLLKKPWKEASTRFREYARTQVPRSGRWNWKVAGRWVKGRWEYVDSRHAPYSYIVHIFSTTAKIAYQYWLGYEYTLDEKWLAERAYPMLKGTAEFYRNYPNVKKGPDGKYHIYNVNCYETFYCGQDTMEEIAAMRGILPILIRASQILNVDAEMRPIWQEFLDNITDLPRNDNPKALNPKKDINSPLLWTEALKPLAFAEVSCLGYPENLVPCIHFDLCTLETKDPEMLKIANDTFGTYTEKMTWSEMFSAGGNIGLTVYSRMPLAAANLGRSEDIKALVPAQMKAKKLLANRLNLDEGFQATTAEHIGRASEALQLALCQAVPAGPAKEPVIHVFPAWPRDWDGAYTLLCRGGFLVTSSMQKGQIEFIEIKSQLGGQCRLRNPWGSTDITLYRNGEKYKDMTGSLLKFETDEDQSFVIVPKGSSPEQFKRTIL